jgi:hypothetical protein
MNSEMNYATADGHVPDAKRSNRTIQERIRAAYHNLPYSVIPKVMIKYLAMICTQQLNYFPAKGGISPYYSPHVILTGKPLDYIKHCQLPFGFYVQANHEPHPTYKNAPRTIDCIYLRSFPNIQGGHELMNLRTGRVISRHRIVEVTELVIQAVENMAIQQRITTSKITGRNQLPIYPADWIAGVNYNQNFEDDDEYQQVEIDDDEDALADDINDEEYYDRIDPEEVEYLIENDHNENENDEENMQPPEELNEPNPVPDNENEHHH